MGVGQSEGTRLVHGRGIAAAGVIAVAALGSLGCLGAAPDAPSMDASSAEAGADSTAPDGSGAQEGSTENAEGGDASADVAEEGEAAGPDFVLTLGVPLASVLRGSSATVPVDIAAVGGFADSVNVTVTGLPGGVTAAPLTLAAGATAGSLTLSAASSAAVGDGPTLTVTASGGALSHQATIGLLVRDTAGTFDVTFGSGGVTNDSAFVSDFSAMALQPDGKIVVCGEFDELPVVAFVRRYNADGSPDSAFGASQDDAQAPGMITLPAPMPSTPTTCSGIAVLPSGDIAVGGTAGGTEPWVAEVTSAGLLDSSFGQGGTATAGDLGGGTANGLVVDSAGNLTTAGIWTGTSQPLLLVRWTSVGQLDPSFGARGYFYSSYPNATGLNAIALDPSGNLLVALASMSLSVQRFTSGGHLDGAFQSGGTSTLTAGSGTSTAVAVAPSSDGSVYLAGSATPSTDGSAAMQMALAHVASTGLGEPAFGGSGAVAVAVGSGPSYADAVAVDSAGRAVVAGHIESVSAASFGVARFAFSGGLDPSFANGQGYVTTSGADARAVAILPDGRILAGGTGGNYKCQKGAACNAAVLQLARFWP